MTWQRKVITKNFLEASFSGDWRLTGGAVTARSGRIKPQKHRRLRVKGGGLTDCIFFRRLLVYRQLVQQTDSGPRLSARARRSIARRTRPEFSQYRSNPPATGGRRHRDDRGQETARREHVPAASAATAVAHFGGGAAEVLRPRQPPVGEYLAKKMCSAHERSPPKSTLPAKYPVTMGLPRHPPSARFL